MIREKLLEPYTSSCCVCWKIYDEDPVRAELWHSLHPCAPAPERLLLAVRASSAYPPAHRTGMHWLCGACTAETMETSADAAMAAAEEKAQVEAEDVRAEAAAAAAGEAAARGASAEGVEAARAAAVDAWWESWVADAGARVKPRCPQCRRDVLSYVSFDTSGVM